MSKEQKRTKHKLARARAKPVAVFRQYECCRNFAVPCSRMASQDHRGPRARSLALGQLGLVPPVPKPQDVIGSLCIIKLVPGSQAANKYM